MHKLNTKLYFFRIVDYDYRELLNFKKEYDNEINRNPFIDTDAAIFEFFKLLHNYLSSTNLFLNQYSANIKRDYDIEFFKEFEDTRQTLFDENLSYKIIYNLRNEMHHSSLPQISIKVKRNIQKKFESQIFIEKNYLKIGKLKNDEEFMQLNDLIDIFEHIENMNSYLMILSKKIIKYELDNHDKDYEFLKSLLDEIKIEGKPCIIKFNAETNDILHPNITFLNENLIILIYKIKNYNFTEN